jgi:hypothetical protein
MPAAPLTVTPPLAFRRRCFRYAIISPFRHATLFHFSAAARRLRQLSSRLRFRRIIVDFSFHYYAIFKYRYGSPRRPRRRRRRHASPGADALPAFIAITPPRRHFRHFISRFVFFDIFIATRCRRFSQAVIFAFSHFTPLILFSIRFPDALFLSSPSAAELSCRLPDTIFAFIFR